MLHKILLVIALVKIVTGNYPSHNHQDSYGDGSGGHWTNNHGGHGNGHDSHGSHNSHDSHGSHNSHDSHGSYENHGSHNDYGNHGGHGGGHNDYHGGHEDHGSHGGHGGHGHGDHAYPEGYDAVAWEIIPPPPGPGDIVIPSIQELGETRDTINRCLTDDSRGGLWGYYLMLVETVERRPCYLLQALFNNCLGDLNYRTCVIQQLTGARCNIFTSTGPDFLQFYLSIHQFPFGGNATDILKFINPTAVRQLVVAANNYCPGS